MKISRYLSHQSQRQNQRHALFITLLATATLFSHSAPASTKPSELKVYGSVAKELSETRAALDPKKSADAQREAFDHAQKKQCDSLKENVAKTPQANDAPAVRDHEEYVDQLLLLTSRMTEVNSSGSEIENCFADYFTKNSKLIKARMAVVLTAAQRAKINEGLSDYFDSKKEPDKKAVTEPGSGPAKKTE